MQFLRIRKFNLDNTFKSFENFFIFRRKYSKWLANDDEQMNRVWQLFDCGYAFPLLDRDNEQKKIIFIQVRKFDTSKFTSCDAIRLLALIVGTLMEEEETQIAGISSISDYTDVTYQYFNLFSINDIKNFAIMAKNASVGREKENYFVNLPPFASFLFEIGKKALNEKLRNRLILTRNMDELKRNHINASMLPRECGGGDVCESEMMNNFKRLYKKHESKILKISDCDIDWESCKLKDSCKFM